MYDIEDLVGSGLLLIGGWGWYGVQSGRWEPMTLVLVPLALVVFGLTCLAIVCTIDIVKSFLPDK